MNIDNLFAKEGFWWWVGVVEDRQDPLKLGRCRVRIIGYHIDNKAMLPTQDLPWAFPMQPIISAANSGKGITPLGPLEGTWVIGFFADGSECQQPIMMGTVGGIPQKSPACETAEQNENNTANAQTDTSGNPILDETGKVVPLTPTETNPAATVSNSIASDLPPLTQAQVQTLMDSIAARESSSVAGGVQNYDTIGGSKNKYYGKYQFGSAALITQGYVKRPIGPNADPYNVDLTNSINWTGAQDVNNLQDFLANKNNAQESAMYANLSFNYSELTRLGVIDAGTTSADKAAGYLAAAHLKGAGGAKQLSLGRDNVDDFGTQASEYYSIGAQAIGGTGSKPVAAANRSSAKSALNTGLEVLRSAAGALNNPKLGQPDPYADPNSVYPKCAYTKRADTNKLATNNDDLKTTPKPEKDKTKISGIETANGASGTWNEPPSAYAAKYPYNHVKETESGHVVEFDDTPNAERIHIYHKTGTYVEIDREGSVSYKVLGENYNIYGRNNRVYTQGNMDVTVDGANTLLVKNTWDVEVVGKTTINLKDDADINVSKDLRIKAQNIYMEAQQDINITAGNYENHKIGGDLNFRVTGDEQHRVTGSIDMDAQDINLNSGTANPYTATATNLDAGELGGVVSQGFAATGLNPLPQGIANPQNSIGKGLSGVLGGFTGGGLGLLGNALSNPAIANALSGFSQAGNLLGTGALQGVLGNLGGGGVGSILNIAGVDGLNSVLSNSGIPSLSTLLGNAAANPAIANAISGLGNLDSYISTNGLGSLNNYLNDLGVPTVEKVIANAGLDLTKLTERNLGQVSGDILSAIKSSGLIPSADLLAGDNLITNFYKNGVGSIDTTLAANLVGKAVDATEFASWTDFPATAQLSKYFTLGALTTLVADTNSQFAVQDQADLTRYDIVSNLKALSVNVLDPLNEQYPNLVISSGFSPTTDYLMSMDDNNAYRDLISSIQVNASADQINQINTQLSTATPLMLGKGVTLHFPGATVTEYYTIAQWIKNNIAFDQLRLEYTTLGNQEPWITVSYDQIANRAPDYADKIVSVVNGQIIANYLVDLST